MSGFKLLAIRPLEGCDDSYSKNLTKGQIYKFYNNYDFLDEDNNKIGESKKDLSKEVFEIVENANNSAPSNLYNIKTLDEYEITVNISAIVGENGSGKSSLLEILYALCYVIASKKGLIDDHNTLAKKINQKGIDQDILIKTINSIQDLLDGLNVEVFYEIIGKGIFSITFKDDKLTHLIFNNKKLRYFSNGNYDIESTNKNLLYVYNNLFYYTISINYSIYGLNTNIGNKWLNLLFLKKDGYQTPLVLNPFRDKGNININTEYHLAQTRLFSNIINNDYTFKSIVNNKKIDSVIFTLNPNLYNNQLITDFDNFKKKENITDIDFFVLIYNSLNKNHKTKNEELDFKKIKNFEYLILYVFRKTFKIIQNYNEYKNEIELFNTNNQLSFKIKDFNNVLNKFKDDKSHVTLKLRQILNVIRFNILIENNVSKWKDELNYNVSTKSKKNLQIIFSINEISERIKNILNKYPKFEIIELIPASFFLPQFIINNSENKNSKSIFEILSSGEQQYIHSLNSILYHISNLDSVFKTNAKKIRYNYINIVLDEIELYYHPEFQRKFISNLLDGISSLKIENIKGINILFSTHSPFILSDIPNQNILKLKDGNPKPFNESEKTYGANIHDLLANDFFLENGYIGEFAKEKINETINWIMSQKKLKEELKETYVLNENEYKKNKEFIKIIGEKIIRFKLAEMLGELKGEKKLQKELIEKEIEFLQEKIKNYDTSKS